MSYIHLVSGATNISGPCSKLRIQVNSALTGAITVSDETTTTGSPVVAIITNPTVGNVYEYWDLKTGATITLSATGDITAMTYGGFGPK